MIQGEDDPWLTGSSFEVKKYHRAFLPTLINKMRVANPTLTSAVIEYRGISESDTAILATYYKDSFGITFIPLTTDESVTLAAVSQIAQITSPPLSEIIKFTLLWSDNDIAQRLALLAARKLGFPWSSAGMQSAFVKVLSQYGVPTDGLVVIDGAGLSHDTRVSAITIAYLLEAINNRTELRVIDDGLPLAGKTGTLKYRFTTDAPAGVGLVRAKTGWIDTSVSLAGFVTVGPRNYIFAIIADQIKNSENARNAARVTIDKMLAAIARPTR